MRFGLVFGFKWLRMIAGAALIAILYLGGWSGPVFVTLSVGGVPVPIVPEEAWFLLKIYLISIVFIWISWSVPRVRIDQILNIGWRKLIPYSLAAIILAAAAIASGLWAVGGAAGRAGRASSGGGDAMDGAGTLTAFVVLWSVQVAGSI